MNANNKIIFIIGGPGSGKGTQCSRLVRNIPSSVHISSGDLLRKEAKTNESIKRIIDSGLLVPSHVSIGLVIDEINKYTNTIFLLDGFHRQYEQTLLFEQQLKHYHVAILCVIYFNCSHQTMINRLLNRNQSDRSDDNIVAIQQRLNVFQSAIEPILNYYSDMVITVNSEIDANSLQHDILNALSTRI